MNTRDRCAEQDWLLEQTRARVAGITARIASCERALGRLRTVVSPAVLIERVCDELATGCSFDRVLLSRVEGGQWRPWKVNQTVHAEGWFGDWQDSEILFSDLVLEDRLLTERRAAVVADTSDAHPFFQAGASPSYAVAPICTGLGAVGFLHADHGRGGRPCDQTDQDLLWAFTEGFAHLYERTVLLQRLSDQRSQVRQTLGLVDRALQRFAETELELVARPDEESSVSPSERSRTSGLDLGPVDVDLTPREREVLAVLATGASNQAIADRLVLSTGTVKTHVKHVLAKLGVRSRAEAIARYVHSTPRGGTSPHDGGSRSSR